MQKLVVGTSSSRVNSFGLQSSFARAILTKKEESGYIGKLGRVFFFCRRENFRTGVFYLPKKYNEFRKEGVFAIV